MAVELVGGAIAQLDEPDAQRGRRDKTHLKLLLVTARADDALARRSLHERGDADEDAAIACQGSRQAEVEAQPEVVALGSESAVLRRAHARGFERGDEP